MSGLGILTAATLLATFSQPVASALPDRVINGYVVGGSILNEYVRLEGIGKSPGNPISGELDDRQNGKFQKFVNNNYIYWNARVDTQFGKQVGGAIWDKWGQYDWENGDLGYPIEPEKDAVGGKLSRFERGLIYWSASTGAHPVWGQILQTWSASGYEQSSYGFPAGDEEVIGEGRRQLFQNGQYIEWQPEGFPADWEGDSQQDEDTSDNTDQFFPNCGNTCARDSTVRVTGHPIKNTTGMFRSSEPQAESDATVPEDGAQYCDELQPDPTAEPGDGVFCIVRDDLVGTDEGTPNREGTAPIAPSTETSSPTPTRVSPTPSTDTPAPASPTSSIAATTEPLESTTPTASTTQACPTTTTTTAQMPAEDEALCGDTPSERSQQATTTTSDSDEPAASNFMGSRNRGPARTALPNAKDYCLFGHPDYEYKKWAGDRDFQCRTKLIEIGMADRQTATYFGRILVEETRTLQLAWNNTAWEEQLGIRVQNVLPEPFVPGALGYLESVMLQWDLTCNYSVIIPCYNNGGAGTIGPKSVVQLQGAGTSTLVRKGIVAPPAGSAQGLSSWRFTSSSPKFTTVTALTGFAPVIRCDAGVGLRNSQGCAFPHVPPILDYTEFPGLGDFTNHVKNAQQSGLPGGIDSYALSRVVSKSTIRANRRGSCGGVTGPRPTGKSCDEYPFASANEGARVGGPNSGSPNTNNGRTFANCGIKDNDLTGSGPYGYSVCMIDRGQNSSAGSILGWFYAKNRVMDTDRYYVYVG